MSRVRPKGRRRYRRRTVRVAVVYESELGSARATATTLGAGGMFIATEEPLPPRTKLEVEFCLPEQHDILYRIPARVVWSNAPPQESGALGMGISFEDAPACASLAAELERD